MRIAVCTKHDIFGATVLNAVLPRLAGHAAGLFMSVRERTEVDDSVPELDLMRLVERQVPTGMLFPLLDAAPPVPGRALTPGQWARRLGCPLTLVHDMAPHGGTAAIEAFGAEAILSVRFSYLFRRSTIAQVPGRILNVHPGPLPWYRGLYTPFWQMLDGQPALRCTVHLVDLGVDTGPVLAMESVALDRSRSMMWHAAQLYLRGAARAVDYILDGIPAATPQDPAQARKTGFPSPDDFARFRAAGFHLVRGRDVQELLLPFIGQVDGQGGGGDRAGAGP